MKPVRLAVTAVVVLVVSALGGRAFASLHASGSGTGQATVGTVTLDIVAVPDGDVSGALLSPGRTGSLVITVHNTFKYPITVMAAQPAPLSRPTTDDAHAAACAASNVLTLASPIPVPTAGMEIGPLSTRTLVLPLAVTMLQTAPNGCQHATFKVPVKVTART